MTHYSKGSEKPPLPKDRLRLYNMRFCPFAQRTRLILAAKGVDYECININLKDRPDWYLDVNPNGTVPSIELSDGKCLYESVICCEYVEDENSKNRPMYPSNPFRRNEQRLLIDVYTKKVVPKYYKVLREKDDASCQELTEQLKVFDNKLAELKTPFFGGEKPGMLDYLMWPWLEKLPLFSKEIVPALPWTKDQFPVLYDWYKAMAEDPAVKECAYPLDWYKQFIQGYYVGKSESQLIGSDVKS